LRPSDRISVVALGVGAVSVPFTTDRQRVRQAVEKAVGGIPYPPLPAEKTSGEQTIETLKNVLLELAAVDVPKTLVLISQGLVLNHYRYLVDRLEEAAVRSRTIIYGLRLDTRISDITRKTQDTSLGPDLTEPPAGNARGAGRSQGVPDVPRCQAQMGAFLQALPKDSMPPPP
jgi:hypothetical protein